MEKRSLTWLQSREDKTLPSPYRQSSSSLGVKTESIRDFLPVIKSQSANQSPPPQRLKVINPTKSGRQLRTNSKVRSHRGSDALFLLLCCPPPLGPPPARPRPALTSSAVEAVCP
ncbi:meiosis 1 arrest protein [Lates japonicus]|uniref:Meiosis 1 arrest protein n=1 Tax=Lates japonicus TaxID=270547 RepID=A0AAD3RK79_LATJO|nr:meiosis 1 arrest protein [Lates japonicus]